MSQTTKAKYRVRNREQYNRSLINRGSITFWFSEDVIAQRNLTIRSGTRGKASSVFQRSHYMRFNDQIHLPICLNKATQGYLESVIKLMGLW